MRAQSIPAACGLLSQARGNTLEPKLILIVRRSPAFWQFQTRHLRNPFVVISNVGESLSEALFRRLGDCVVGIFVDKTHDTDQCAVFSVN